ncbi:reprolysin-like metallopeptidase [Pseudomonas sp. FYR_11]|uniref:reprolysin-like metallopeptidase n=1 Tax=Pseudomonas TaxID=286 RepID=UPI003709CBCC
MKLWLRLISATILVSAISGVLASDHNEGASPTTQLFQLAVGDDLEGLKRDRQVYPLFSDLLKDPATQHVQRVVVNSSLVDQANKTLSVPLGHNKTATFRLRRSVPPAPGMVGWVGDSVAGPLGNNDTEIVFDPFTWISLVRDGQRLTGAIHVEGAAYRLQYVGGGQHVLVKVDEAKMPAEHFTDVRQPQTDPGAGKAPESDHSTIRVLFFTTHERRVKNPDYRATLARVVQDANQVMLNSNVPVTVSIAGFMEPDYKEGDKTGVEQFTDFRTPGRDLNNEVQRWRDELLADVVTLYTSYPGTGGEVATGGYVIVGAADAFAHEIGHVLGAAHGWNGTSPGYKFGYSHDNPKFHTRMVTTWGSIPYFSNPRLTYQGVPMGTPEHHDVARTLDEHREEIENLYPPPPAPRLYVELYAERNFLGQQCSMFMVPGMHLPPCTAVKSMKVSDFTDGSKLCLKSYRLDLSSCYVGAYAGDFEVADIDKKAALPHGLRREASGSKPLVGNIDHVEYARDDKLTIQLYSQANFRGASCELRLPAGAVYDLSTWAACSAVSNGKSRSAKVYGFLGDARKLCFHSETSAKSLCFSGSYKGRFEVANWDSGSGLPENLIRVHRGGGYMNGAIYRVSYDIDTHDQPPMPSR